VSFDQQEEPPKALIDLARASTTGDVSPRRHQASRARVLDRWATPKRTGAYVIGALVGTFALGTAAFAGSHLRRHDAAAPNGANGGGVITPEQSTPATDDDAKSTTEADRASDGAQDEEAEHAIQITVEPEGANVFWDDEPIPGYIDREPDQKPHRVRVEATGYVTKTQIVVADKEKIRLEMKLSPMPVGIGPVTHSGALANADEVVEGLRERFHDCYAEGLSQDPSIKGTVTLTLRVAEDGHVTASDLGENHGLSAKVTTCIAYVGTDATFREAETASTVRIPLSFGMPTK
jgi:hypothetical protein